MHKHTLQVLNNVTLDGDVRAGHDAGGPAAAAGAGPSRLFAGKRLFVLDEPVEDWHDFRRVGPVDLVRGLGGLHRGGADPLARRGGKVGGAAVVVGALLQGGSLAQVGTVQIIPADLQS